MNRLVIIFTLLATACAAPDPRQVVHVGYVEHDCSAVRNDEQIVSIPLGLKVTPVEAASSLQSLPMGCWAKFAFEVYADSDNYYFYDNTQDVFSFRGRSTETVKSQSFVVDGRTGELIRFPDHYGER